MKGLVVDSATNRLTVAAKNDDKVFISVYDVGMHQSKTLVPAIEFVLKQVELESSQLDYTALCIGPGSFTGLRIAAAALKAIELTYNVPVYGISTLEAYAFPFKDFEIPVLSCVDAKKDKFYGALFSNEKQLLQDGDYEISELADAVKNYPEVFIAGMDAKLLKEQLVQIESVSKVKFITSSILPVPAESLFELTEQKIKNGTAPLQDYDGPVYLRASEAEVKLTSSKA